MLDLISYSKCFKLQAKLIIITTEVTSISKMNNYRFLNLNYRYWVFLLFNA